MYPGSTEWQFDDQWLHLAKRQLRPIGTPDHRSQRQWQLCVDMASSSQMGWWHCTNPDYRRRNGCVCYLQVGRRSDDLLQCYRTRLCVGGTSMAGGKANTFDNDLLKLIFNATPIANIADNAATSPLTNLYLSLHTADPGAGGNQTTNEA